MAAPRQLILKTSTLAYPLLLALVIWVVLWIELTYHVNFNDWGIRPRTLIGLRGIICGPFIHAGVPHALSNTLPIILLGVALFYFYEGIAWRVLLYGTLLTGLMTWLIGRGGSTHIGASGMAYLMMSFLFFKGLWSKNYRLIALSLIVVFIYGGLIWGVFPGKAHVSWEGHLSGFASGILFSLIYYHYKIETPDHETPLLMSPQEAEFMRHFDKEGNFVPTSEKEEHKGTDDKTLDVDVNYHYRSGKKKED